MRRERIGGVSTAILLLALAVSPKRSLVSADSHNNNGSMTAEVNFGELRELLADKHIFVLDVRESQEIKEDGAIPGSVNLPLSTLKDLSTGDADFKEAVGRPIDPSGRNMILSCRSGRRALAAFDIIKALGYGEAKVYRGSFSDWMANGGEIIKESH